MSEKLKDSVGGESSGDKHEEFLRYFSKDRRRIYKFIYSLVPVAADAEDVFQQTSMALWKSFERYDPDREFYSWACGVAYYAVQNFRRTSSRRRLLFSDDLVRDLADERLEGSKNSLVREELLEECIARLQEKDRRLLTEVYREGASPSEYAVATSRNVRTIYNRLHLIRRKLLECVNRKLATSVQ